MGRHLAPLLLSFLSCDSLLVSNPQNCERNPTACSADQYCDLTSKTCQTLDCQENPTLCQASEYCSSETHRCTRKDCTLDATLCAADQRCNPTLRACQTLTFVLGQPDEVSNLNLDYGMNRPDMVRLAPDPNDSSKTRLLVADTANRRVLIWNTLPTSNRPADAVLGLPDTHTISSAGPYGGVNEGSISGPWGLATDGRQVAVGDLSLNRVLLWNTIPTQPPTRGPIAANRLWGQSSFLGSSPDAGGSDPSALGIRNSRVFMDRTPGTEFYISDQSNHRVLFFPAFPGGSTVTPTYILGQPNGITALAGTSATALRSPRDVTLDGQFLWVTDTGNHRVLGFPWPITGTGISATAVLGQTGFTTGTSGAGITGLTTPYSVTATKSPRVLWVSEGGNNRVLRYSAPTGMGMLADLVLGQMDFGSGAPNRGMGPDANTLATPAGVDTDGVHLAVADYGNNRVLLWNTLPTGSSQAADVVLGQPSASTNGVNMPPSRGPLQFTNPRGLATDGTRLFLADYLNHRVLIWNQIPRTGSTPPDLVLGQPDFVSVAPNGGGPVSASGFSLPVAITVEGGRLAVSDHGNSRVLIWNQIPTQNNQPADICLGQASCSTAVVGTSAGQFRNPYGLRFASGRLYVADTNNHRVLRFDAPVAQGSLATRVLGQQNLTSGGANSGGLSASTLLVPRGVFADGNRVLVADGGNHRVLIWNSLPTRDGQPADVVVGQASFGNSYTRPDRVLVENPIDVLVDQGHLYVPCTTQSRVLYWDQIPTKNGMPADRVLGQPDFASALPNHPDMPALERLSAPASLLRIGNQLLISDVDYNRVVVRSLPM